MIESAELQWNRPNWTHPYMDDGIMRRKVRLTRGSIGDAVFGT
jgi:hypothetical protein